MSLHRKPAAFALLLAASCGDAAEPMPPAGGGCRYVGTEVDGDSAAAPLGADRCHFIGTVNPLSGPLGAVGLALENSARLAVRDVNRAGMLAGKRLCLIACDDKTDSATAKQAVTDLIGQYGIIAVNGGAASSSSLKIAEAIRNEGSDIAQVSCCSTSPELTMDPRIYRTVPSDALQGVVLANLARGLEPPAQRVAVIHLDDTYGRSLKDVFVGAFRGLGGEVTQQVAYQASQPSYTRQLEVALDPAPDHVVLIAFPADGAQVMRDWYATGLAPRARWLATDGLKDNRFVIGSGAVSDEVIGTAPVLTGKRFTSFEQRYRDQYTEAPGIFTSNQYDAVILIALAIARTGSADPAMIRARIPELASAPGVEVTANDIADALAKARVDDVNYSGASGEVEMDAAGDVVSDYNIWVVGDGAANDTAETWSCTPGAMGVTCARVPRG